MLVQFSICVYVFLGLFKFKNIFTKEKNKRDKIFFNMPVIVYIYTLSVYCCIIWLSPNPIQPLCLSLYHMTIPQPCTTSLSIVVSYDYPPILYNLSVYHCIIWLSPNPDSWTDHLFINLKFPARLNSLSLSKIFTWRTKMIDLEAVAMIYSVSYFVPALSFLFRNTAKWEIMKHYLYINKISTIDPFTITAALHSSGTFVSGKMMISRTNHDTINAYNCSMTSFYGKGYYH